MRTVLVALSAAGLLSGCATSGGLSTLPMATPPPPPEACMTGCPELPSPPAEADEGSGVAWVFEVIDAAGACRRLHDDCRAARARGR